MKKTLGRFLKEEEGIGVVEVILILVVIIALVLIFKTQIVTLVRSLFSSITSGVESILK